MSDYLQKFMDENDLRGRERKICEWLIGTNMSYRELAKVFKKRSEILRNYASEVYEKTNASGRLGLMIMYQEFLEYENEQTERKANCKELAKRNIISTETKNKARPQPDLRKN